jgi:hypothetical protein
MRIVEENWNAVAADGVCFTLGAMLTQRVEDLYDLHQPSRSLPGNAVAASLELLSDQHLESIDNSARANGDEFASHRHTASDLHSNQRFERPDRCTRTRNLSQ